MERVPKKSKTSKKSVISTGLSKLELLPIDALKEIAVNLDYEEIFHLCRTSKKLKSLCGDPYFWKSKIRYDFGNVNIGDIPIEKLQAKYLLLLADKLDTDAEKLIRELDRFNGERRIEIQPFQYELRNLQMKRRDEVRKAKTNRTKPDIKYIDSRIKLAQQNIEDINAKYKGISDKISNLLDQLLAKADNYRKQGERRFPIIFDRKYIKIKMADKDRDEFSNVLEEADMDYGIINGYLLNKGFIKEPLKPGNLIGINESVSQPGFPEWFGYVGYNRGKPYISSTLPGRTDTTIPWDLEYILTHEEINEIYDLPFDIGATDEALNAEQSE
jgi:hypothetical protein